MARNRIVRAKTAKDIDRRVERVLRGLGHPELPLRLEDVRELLQLDLALYTADDPGVMRETISHIRVVGIQAYKRPMLVFDAIRKLSLGALSSGSQANSSGRGVAQPPAAGLRVAAAGASRACPDR